MWDVLTIAVLLLSCTLGLLMTAVRLPGTWLIVLTAVGYGWFTGWERVSGVTVILLAAAATVGEIVEFVASMVTAKRAGASRQAAWGGLIGGFAGMILFSIPVPILGTLVGAILGCFVGAAVTEFIVRRKVGQGTKVGLFAAIGFVLGTATKTAVALGMAGLLLTSVMCSRSETPPGKPDDSALSRSESSRCTISKCAVVLEHTRFDERELSDRFIEGCHGHACVAMRLPLPINMLTQA